MGRVLFLTFACGVAGLLAWVLAEPFAPHPDNKEAWSRFEVGFLLLLGALVGGTIGAANGWYQGSRAHMLRGLLLGILAGAMGGTIGYQIGGALANLAFGPAVFLIPGFSPTKVLARIVAFLPMGVIIGAAAGAGTRSWARVRNGALGGLLAAALAGALFDIVAFAYSTPIMMVTGGTETGIVSRGLTAVCIGAGIGLFTGLVERLARSAWLRLILGRNERKEWVVDAPQTFIGRSETAHVPLFGDTSVAPMHACIMKQNGVFMLVDGGSPNGTYLNGQRVQQVPLFSGAMITIGSHQLEFVMREGAAPQRAAEALRQQAVYAGGPHGTPVQGAVPAQPWQMQQPQPQSQPTQHIPSYPPSPTPQPAQAPALVALTGPLTGQRWVVQGQIEAGREAPGIPLNFDSAASRRHAVFALSPQGLMVNDLGSTNGTMVNGQRVQSSALRPGDQVTIGATTFRVEG
jgi:pSer/pThr/pTyr-binding forkhead associated (FHA) protein